MPVKINLWAELQEAEEARRKDPARRALWLAAFCISMVVLWMLKIQIDIQFSRWTFRGIQRQYNAAYPAYVETTNNQFKITQIDQKLAALDRLATNRFLWGPVLNALQKTMVDDVHVIRLSGVQTYKFEPPHTIHMGGHKRDFPASVVENISLHIEANDLNPKGVNYLKYKSNLSNFDFFVKHLKRHDGFILGGILASPPMSASNPTKQFVTFTLDSDFPQVRRNDE